MKKKHYESPRSQGVALHAEGVVCGSITINSTTSAFDEISETDKSSDWDD